MIDKKLLYDCVVTRSLSDWMFYIFLVIMYVDDMYIRGLDGDVYVYLPAHLLVAVALCFFREGSL